MAISNKREVQIVSGCLALTVVIIAGLAQFLGKSIYTNYVAGHTRLWLDAILFAVAMGFMMYGSLLYQICLIGHYKRKESFRPATRAELNTMYGKEAPSLSILVPSYKEERKVIWQTLISAALAEYPHKNVVLLIDDPYPPRAMEDMLKIEETRQIPIDLQSLFDKIAERFQAENIAFFERRVVGKIHTGVELNRLSMLYEEVAVWLEALAVEFAHGQSVESLPHGERFFVQAILQAPAEQHRMLAEELRQKINTDEMISPDFLERHFARLASLFQVKFSSFERKKYINLSHEANKAMNLNSYISLLGKSWREVKVTAGWELHETTIDQADFTIPDSDYINTIDADSLMLPEYALRLIHLMEQPGNERLAVVQSPVSAFPDCPASLERAASSCLDLQFVVHQGFTHWNASFWVGANAMLRRVALEDIKEIRHEGKNAVEIYIQDRTVIEDTESSIDIVAKGWKLYNYPERLSYSAMPSDFGSLLIQRRRWANGGLIILPKLFSYVKNAPKNFALFKELFMRFHYLASTTIGCAVMALFAFYPFGSNVETLWVPLSIVPCLFLYVRLLRLSGYNYADMLSICALNLMLIPVLIGGVLKQFQQMITGKKIPFGRTPKVTGRTAAPAIYYLVEATLMAVFLASGVIDVQNHNWVAAGVSLGNAGLMVYVLLHFIGIKALAEDIMLEMMMRWREAFHHAEIIPLRAGRWIPTSFTAVRKRA